MKKEKTREPQVGPGGFIQDDMRRAREQNRSRYAPAFLCACLIGISAAGLDGAPAGRLPPKGKEAREPAAQKTPPDSRSGLTLADCYRLTIARSESDQILREDIKLAEAKYRSALAGFVPELGLFASKTKSDEVELSRDPARNPARDGESGRPISDPAAYLTRRTPTTNPFFSGAFVRIPLFNGFRNYYDAAALRHETEQHRYLRARGRELLFQDIALVFFQTLQYEETIVLLGEEAQALAGRVNELARDRRLGRARPSELLTAQADLAASRAEAENARGVALVSRELLAFLIGLPEKEWRLVDNIESPAAADLEAYLKNAQERKDVLAILTQIRSRRGAVRSARAGHLPSLSLDGSYYLQQRPDTGRDWTISLRLELPLFSGGGTAAATDARLVELRQSELSLSRLRRSAVYDVRVAYHDFIAGAARTLLLDEAAQLYQDAYAALQREYRYGLVRNLEVLDSLRRLYQARRAALQARFATKAARVRLHVAAGHGADSGLKEVAPSGGTAQ